MARAGDIERAPRQDQRGRSRVSNGRDLPGGVSGRSREGRRYLDLIADLTAELGGNLSHSETLAVRNVATLQLQAEHLQGDLLRGGEGDPEELVRLTRAQASILATLRRRPRRQKPSATDDGLDAYLRRQGEG